MFGPLLLLFLVVPLVELFIIVQVAGGLGILETIALLVLVSVVGAYLVRREGFSVYNKMQAQLAKGSMPTNEIIDGAMILGGGALMLTPGFLTDAIGLGLLLPPVRAVVRPMVRKRVQSRVAVVSPFGGAGSQSPFGQQHPPRPRGGFGRRGRGPVYDAESREEGATPREPPSDPGQGPQLPPS